MAAAAQAPLMNALIDKMRWHQARQSVLAENVANAETPGYEGRDLKAYRFEEHLRDAFPSQLATALTDPAHLEPPAMDVGFDISPEQGFETTPQGNSVTLEDQMMKIAGNQMDYQAITSLYSRSMRMIRTALGRSA